MKKFIGKLNILVCSILVGFVVMLSGCFTYSPKATSIEIMESTIPNEVTIEDFNLSDIKIIVNKIDGAIEIISVTKDMLSDEALEKLTKSGTHYIYIRYSGKLALATITLLEKYPNVLVTFDSLGGSSVKRQVVEKNSLALRPTDPTRNGYIFTGWYVDSALQYQFSFSYPISENTTLYAGWEAISNVVKFETNGGSAINDIGVKTGDAFKLPEAPIKEGYTFEGWYLDKALTKPYQLATITESITLYAKWTLKICNVRFETDCGNEINDVNLGYGEKLNKPITPVKEGYTFVGWYLDSELTKEYDFDSLVKEDLVLYAKWELTNFIVKFQTNGGDKISDLVLGLNELVPSYLSPNRPNYVFKGWYLDSELTIPFDFNEVVTSNITLYAKWEGVELIVQFDTLDGNEISVNKIKYGEYLSRPENPSREGYIFTGWYLDKEGTQLFNFAIPVKSSINLYACWIVDDTIKEKCIVTIYDGNLNIVSQLEVYAGEEIVLPEVKMEGLAFEGWYLDPSYSTPYNEGIKINTNLNIYGNFVDVYIVTFVDKNGIVLEVQEIKRGYSATAVGAPEIEEYDFVGWSHPLDNVTSSFTTHPIYELHKYKVTFVIGKLVIQTQYVESGKTATSPGVIDPYIEEGYVFVGWDKPFDSVYKDITYYAVLDEK